MPALPSTSPHAWSDSVPTDRIVLFGGSGRTLDLLRLATIRSDDIILVAIGTPDPAVQRFADAFAIAVRDHQGGDDIETADAVLVAIGDVAVENMVVRRARSAGAPIHVADRPLVSDFTLLAFVERHASSMRPAGVSAAAQPSGSSKL